MPKVRNSRELTISELENLLTSRRTQVGQLQSERSRVLKQLAVLNIKIKKLGGVPTGEETTRLAPMTLTAHGRARNTLSLVSTMQEVLTRAGVPMKVGDIVQAVLDAGYHSNSSTFRSIVNQTLIKERKYFTNTDRATYEVKK